MNQEWALQNYLNTMNYSIDARPVLNSSAPMVVWIAMRLFKIIDFNNEERLTLEATIMTAWIDNFMTWDPSMFGGITVTFRRSDMIWKSSPFTLWNAASGSVFYTLNGSHPVCLQYDGTVSMDITSLFVVVCEMDVTYFPWDHQVCQVQLKPSVMDVRQMVLVPVPNVSLIASFNPSNSEWQVKEESVVHYVENVSVLSGLYFPTNDPNGYKTMSIYYLNMILKRNPVFYVYNIIAPVCIITCLSLLSYFIPCASGERIGLTVSAFLSFSVFQSYVNNFIPRAETIPMINMYILSQMVLSAICVLSGVITLLLNETDRRMPEWIRKFVFFLAHVMCVHVHEHEREPSGEENAMSETVSSPFSQSNWKKCSVPSLEMDGIRPISIRTTSMPDGVGIDENTTSSNPIDRSMIITNGQFAVTTRSIPRHTCGEKTDWYVLNDVLNRLTLILSFIAIMALTLYYLLFMQIDG